MNIIDFAPQVARATAYNPVNLAAQGLTARKGNPGFDENPNFTEDTYSSTRKALLDANPGKLLYSLKECSAIIGISYEYVRILVNTEQLPAKSFGRRRLVHLDDLCRLVTSGVYYVCN